MLEWATGERFTPKLPQVVVEYPEFLDQEDLDTFLKYIKGKDTIKASEAGKLTGGVVTIGNGFNDIQMSDAADLSICVIGREGCCGALLSHCDVVVTSIHDALDLLLKTDRLRATLRT